MEASLLEDLDDDDSPAPVQHEVDVDPVESPNNGGESPVPMEDLDDDYGDEPITTNGNHNNHVEENYVPPAPYPVTTTATNGASSTTPTGGPRSLKPWPLPPSLTPKKRGFSRSEVPLDLDSTPDENGAWKCGTCEASYDSRIGLFAHTRFCAGRVADWACEWCSCNEHETNHKASGPSGPKTLCAACGQRYRHGAEGMPQQNAAGEWLCPNCNRPFPTMGALGGHRRFCDGGVWRCQVCGRMHALYFIMFALSSLSLLYSLSFLPFAPYTVVRLQVRGRQRQGPRPRRRSDALLGVLEPLPLGAHRADGTQRGGQVRMREVRQGLRYDHGPRLAS